MGARAVFEPMALDELVSRLAGAPFRSWVCGGHALELHARRSWRAHDDLDLGVLRRDVAAVIAWLAPLEPMVAAAGELRPWRGQPLAASRHENNVWLRRGADAPWVLDLTLGDGDDERWIYRRDRSITRPWSEAVRIDERGVPYLAPALQLLFKSRAPRPKDDQDAAEVIPALDAGDAAALAELLPQGHPWRRHLNTLP
ncbi:MAG: hypothetical protein KC636_07075 [Myxococcales bacterium]|nr:hypothetical protein [Myxococcales bacterium]